MRIFILKHVRRRDKDCDRKVVGVIHDVLVTQFFLFFLRQSGWINVCL